MYILHDWIFTMYLFYSGSKSYRCRAMANLYNDIQRDKLIYGAQNLSNEGLIYF